MWQIQDFPNQAYIHEILGRKNSSKIYNVSEDLNMLAETSSNPFIFLIGKIEASDIDKITDIIQSYEYPMICCDPVYHYLFIARGWNFHARMELLYPSFVNQALIDKIQKLGLSIKQIDDVELFKQCIEYESRMMFYGSVENFFTSSAGYVLCNDKEIFCEVFVHMGGSYGELSITTHPEHVRKGYGSALSAFVASKLLESGLQPVWSCNLENRASINTALKAGFKFSKYYTLMVPDFGNVLCSDLSRYLEENPYR